MKTRSAITFGPLTLGLSVLALAGTVGAVATSTIAAASAREQSRAEKKGASEAKAAQAALAQRQIGSAIRHAEAAVANQPQVAAYRMMLGQSYLKAGRFASARDAYADALSLDSANGKAALNYALAQIATGDWAGARKTLNSHADTIAVADRGLAIALTGDPVAAVELLAPAARAADADATLRQNFALSLALAGRWREARTVVAVDLAPVDADKRILEWANFAQPKSASDQVASLLGVTPSIDPGRPVALALNAPQAAAPAMAAAEPIDTYMPGKVEAAPAPVEVAAAPEAQAAPVGPSIAGVVFAERKEVVQALPTSAPDVRGVRKLAISRAVLAKIAPVAPQQHVAAKGNFYVQLGAFDNAGVARDAWGRVTRRNAAFAGHTPQGMNVTSAGKTFYRLSVGGFARPDAVALCKTYRAKGGTCFVRAGAGDQVAMWAKGRELASR
ncbi:tetratricopeptide repeat protein [Sphingomonas sp. MMS24-J45]|uniref:SPOR domain-containing protein n=1 Tax=Sphingomonas sp. MMS24-J45 TaxID=3238806 RepID=UPI00384ADD61